VKWRDLKHLFRPPHPITHTDFSRPQRQRSGETFGGVVVVVAWRAQTKAIDRDELI